MTALPRLGKPRAGMKVYLAARYSRRAELQGYAQALAESGLGTADIAWLREPHDWDGSAEGAGLEAAQRFAVDDLKDIVAAHAMVVFTEPAGEYRRGGSLVELGIALGRNIHTVIVGPAPNVFCTLPSVARFATWEEALAHLASWKDAVERSARIRRLELPS